MRLASAGWDASIQLLRDFCDLCSEDAAGARPMNRNLVAIVVLGLWVTVVGMHVRREYFKPEATRLAEGARLLPPGAHFYAVRMGEATIGIASTRFDTTATGFLLTDMTTLDVPALDTVQRAVTQTRIELGRSLELTGFRFTLDSSLGQFLVRGARDGGDGLAVELEAGGGAQRSRVRLEEGLLLDAAVPLRLAAAGALVAGTEVHVKVLDPSTLESRTATIRVVAQETQAVQDSAWYDGARGEWLPHPANEVRVWRLEQTFAGVVLTSFVDEDGMLVRAESPLGFTIQRVAYELAQQGWQRTRGDRGLAAGYGALIEGTAISSNVNLGAVVQAPRLEVRLAGVELAGFDLDGGRQVLRGDTLVISREPAAAIGAGTYALPYRGGAVPPETLAPAPLVQSADPRIIAAARQAVGGATDAATVAARLNDWVYRNVRKELALSVPSALQVLEGMSGDCNEHTVLYVAMARALGLPARTAVGLVHIRGTFYYHAWPEVWLGEWVAVDPTLGQNPADASHLRFLVGGLARQVELIRLIGRLRLEVL
jgi:hypothetical protein